MLEKACASMDQRVVTSAAATKPFAGPNSTFFEERCNALTRPCVKEALHDDCRPRCTLVVHRPALRTGIRFTRHAEVGSGTAVQSGAGKRSRADKGESAIAVAELVVR